MRDEDWDRLFGKGTYAHASPDREVVAFVDSLAEADFWRVLDLGCAYGRHLKILQDKGLSVVGVDWSQAALSMARRVAAAHPHSQILLIRADVASLPFSDGRFDALVSTKVLQHSRMERRRKIVGEISRVIRKDGRILVTVARRNIRSPGWESRSNRTHSSSPKGATKGVVQHYFEPGEITRAFDGFRITNLGLDSGTTHLILEAERSG